MSIYAEIKKYLLYLVGTFCVLLCVHIGILYLYHDAISYPLPGGTVNVGMVTDEVPDLDILTYETKIENNPNDALLRFLYRGIARFSLRDKKIVWDIASCGIDTFPIVRCSINEDAVWNDGSPITNEDVIATYTHFQTNAKNESTKNRLSLVTVTEDEGQIVFTFRTRDATVMELLFLPILRKNDIGSPMTTETLALTSFSGPFVFYTHDERKNTYLLRRNPYYGHEGLIQYFDQIRVGFWVDEESLLDTIDADIVIGKHEAFDDSFVRKDYIRPIFYGVFFNVALAKPLRTAIVNGVLPSIDTKNPDVMPEPNIFLGDIQNTPTVGTDALFAQAATSLGYSYGGSAIAPVEPTVSNVVLVKNLQYVTSPGAMTPLFMSDATIDIGGKTPANTTRVVVNDYTLKNFNARSSQFTYKAQKELGNLINGENIYKILFFNGNNQIASEDITVYYHPDTNELAKIKADWKEKNTPKAEPKPVVISTSLDAKKLYSRESKVLKLKMVIQADVPYFESVAATLSKKIQELGGEVEIVPLSILDIKKNLQDPNFTYDMIISGINLGLFHYNIAPYFHSGQVKEGFNLSRVRDPRLDSLVEKLTERLYYSNPDTLRTLQGNIQTFIQQEWLVYALGSPIEHVSIKENVRGKTVPEYIPGYEMLVDILSRTFFKQGYRMSEAPKNFVGFIEWLKNALFPTA